MAIDAFFEPVLSIVFRTHIEKAVPKIHLHVGVKSSAVWVMGSVKSSFDSQQETTRKWTLIRSCEETSSQHVEGGMQIKFYEHCWIAGLRNYDHDIENAIGLDKSLLVRIYQ